MSTFTVCAFVLTLCFVTSFNEVESTSCSHIETTSDWCRGGKFIWIAGIPGLIHKPSYGVVINLPPTLAWQLNWFCDNSKERVAWDMWANRIVVNYYDNGRIRWNIQRC